MSEREESMNVWLIIGASLVFAGLVGFKACADDMPHWVLKGILAVETRSYLADGQVVYVNQRTVRGIEATNPKPSTLSTNPIQRTAP